MRATPRSRTERARATLAVTWLSAAVIVAGCATDVFAPGASSAPTDQEPMDRIHRQAHAALVRWADAVRASGGASITFVGELTSQIGSWEVAVGENNKSALMAGLVEAPTTLSTDTPSRREVKWLDGTKIEVNVLSAAATLEDLVEAGSANACAGCTALVVTEAQLATGLVETSHGPAEAPVWVYTIEGSAVRVTRVAVDESISVDPPPWNADHPPEGISVESAVGASDSRRLQVSFTGAPEDATKPCGADYTTEAVESDLAVVVIVYEHPNPTEVACRSVGRTRTAEVTLESRLRERTVLEVRQGLPVPVVAP